MAQPYFSPRLRASGSRRLKSGIIVSRPHLSAHSRSLWVMVSYPHRCWVDDLRSSRRSDCGRSQTCAVFAQSTTTASSSTPVESCRLPKSARFAIPRQIANSVRTAGHSPARPGHHSGRISWQAHSAKPRQARNMPSTTPSSRCCSGCAATRQRSAACSISNTVCSPTSARSVRARLMPRPGERSCSDHGWPSAASPARSYLRIPKKVLRSGR